jgi:hypothetical protein
MSEPIKPGDIRYIKLGKGGEWEHVSLTRGELHFGHKEIPHALALTGDREVIKKAVIENGRDPQAAADDAREVVDFYTLGAVCLWVTVAQDHLWWTFAEPEVTWLGEGRDHGARTRRSIGGWRNADINGRPLRLDTLSTKLTKVASYRRTICAVEASDYLLRRINGVTEPVVEKNGQAREALIEAIEEAIKALHWTDFETLVDVIFARSGWHRASAIGGNQKLFDMLVEQPTTDEVAGVQVKSSATQEVLADFVEKADASGLYDRLFFACHSPRGALTPPRDNVHVWSGRDLAATVLRVGLADWVVDRVT